MDVQQGSECASAFYRHSYKRGKPSQTTVTKIAKDRATDLKNWKIIIKKVEWTDFGTEKKSKQIQKLIISRR